MSTSLGSIYRVSPRRLVWPYSATRSLFIFDDCLVLSFQSRRAGLRLMASAAPNDPALGLSGGFGGADVARAQTEIGETHRERSLPPDQIVALNSRNRLIRLDDVERADLDQRRRKAIVGDVSDRFVLSLRDGETVTMWWPAGRRRREVAREALSQALGQRLTVQPE